MSAVPDDRRPTRTTAPADRPTGPTAVATPPSGIPTARRAVDDVVIVTPPVEPAPAPATPPTSLRPAPLDALRLDPAAESRDEHVELVLAELEADAVAASWALRLALLGVVGLIALLVVLL